MNDISKNRLNSKNFDDFNSEVPHNMCSMKGASLLFIVMDHDFLNPNDFSGEAYVPLTSLPGVSKHNTLASGLTPITVPLMQTTENEGKLRSSSGEINNNSDYFSGTC